MTTSANMPGLSASCGFFSSSRASMVRVFSSTIGATKVDARLQRRGQRRHAARAPAGPPRRKLASRSETAALNPDAPEVADAVERRPGLDPAPFDDVLLHDDAARRRRDGHPAVGLAGPARRPALRQREIPERQAALEAAGQRRRDAGAAGRQQLLLRRQQVGAVDHRQRLAAANRLARSRPTNSFCT